MMCSEREINENKIAVEGEFECEIIKEERTVRGGRERCSKKNFLTSSIMEYMRKIFNYAKSETPFVSIIRLYSGSIKSFIAKKCLL
jgi:hypothetical protein